MEEKIPALVFVFVIGLSPVIVLHIVLWIACVISSSKGGRQ